MPRQVSRTPWLRSYEELKEMHDDSSAEVNLLRMTISAPQLGQCQYEFSHVAVYVSVITCSAQNQLDYAVLTSR